MRILFAGSKLQHMPSILFALERMGHEIALYPKPMEDIEGNEEEEKAVENFLKVSRVDFVFSNIFMPFVAKITNGLDMKYAVWCMDSPTYASWFAESRYDNCYFFYIDRRECELRKQSGMRNVYHLPLASDAAWGGQLVITDEEIKKYTCNMSFVGSLYTQNTYDNTIERFPDHIQNVFSGMIEQAAFLWDGIDRLHMPPELVRAVRETCGDYFTETFEMPDEYLFRTYFLGRKLTHVERTLLMELLSQQYDIHLYTRASEKVPEGVRRFGEIDAGEEARKVYYSSRINLNITLRSIAGGIPARVFDVMSVGGFVLSNWQEEIPELFEEGREIATFCTPEELLDKADYYLRHENERIRIGVNAYRKVKENYTYEHQIAKIIAVLYPSP